MASSTIGQKKVNYEEYCEWIEDNMPSVDCEAIRQVFVEQGDEIDIDAVLCKVAEKYDEFVMDDLLFAWDMFHTQDLTDLLECRERDFPAFTLRQTETAMRLHPPTFWHCCQGCDDHFCRCCAGVCMHG